MPQPTAKTLTLRVPLTNAEGQTAVFEGAYQVPLDELLWVSKEELEAAYRAQFAGAVVDALMANGVLWGTTIGQPAAEWGKPKPVVLLPNGRGA
jgi:hypothetical protein